MQRGIPPTKDGSRTAAGLEAVKVVSADAKIAHTVADIVAGCGTTVAK